MDVNKELVVMPWLRIPNPEFFGKFRFITRWEEDTFEDPIEEVLFRKFVYAHREISGTPCREMTLVTEKVSDLSITCSASSVHENLEGLEIAIDCLCVSALSIRDLFSVTNYCNSASFEWYRYQVNSPTRFIVWNRQRSGERWGWHDLNQDFRRVQPEQCTSDSRIKIDRLLLESLSKLVDADSKEGKRILDSICHFRHANRDDTFTSIGWDIGILGSSLEQLMDIMVRIKICS